MAKIILRLIAGWLALLGAAALAALTVVMLYRLRFDAGWRLLFMCAVLGLAGWLTHKRTWARLAGLRAARAAAEGAEGGEGK